MKKSIALVLLLTLAGEQPVYAYLDPGTGSYLMQLIAGSLLAVVTAGGLFWKQIKGALGSLFRRFKIK